VLLQRTLSPSSATVEARRSEENGRLQGEEGRLRPLPDVRQPDGGIGDHSNAGFTCTFLGMSAIFKISQTRPAIFEKQLRRPAADVAGVIASGQQGEAAQLNQQPAEALRVVHDGSGDDDNRLQNDNSADAGGRKRRRL
jgi:hypothetical protein